MSKSILVVSTPENCHYCQFCTMEGSYCEAISGRICRGEAERRPHWCPPIDMPEEISIKHLEEALKRDNTVERAEVREKRIQKMAMIQELKDKINKDLSAPGIREIIDGLSETEAKDLLKDVLIRGNEG